MKSIWQWRVFAVVMVFVAIGFAIWGAQAQEPKPEAQPPQEKTITVTEAQLNELVERRIAHQMIAEQKSMQERILEGRNWHVAVFEDTAFTIYTGPGTVVGVRPYSPPPKQEASTPPKEEGKK